MALSCDVADSWGCSCGCARDRPCSDTAQVAARALGPRVAVSASLAFAGSAWLSAVVGPKSHAVVAYGPTALSISVGIILFWTVIALANDAHRVRVALAAWCAASAMLTALAAVVYLVPSVARLPFLSAGQASVAVNGASYLRIYSPLGDYELFAEMAAIAAVAAMSRLVDSRGNRRIGWAAILVLATIGAVATGTRGGVVILALGMALLWLARRGTVARSRMATSFALLLALGVAFLFVLPVFRGVAARFASIRLSGSLTTDINRQGLWSQFLPHIGLTKEFFLGFGTNFDQAAWPTLPHSLYVYLLNTQGAIGLTLMCLLIVVLVSPYVSSLIGRSAWTPASLLGLMVLLFAVDEVKVEFLRIYNYQLVVWALFGIAVACRRTTANRSRSDAAQREEADFVMKGQS